MDFFRRLEGIVRDKGTSLCVGLDPRVPSGHAEPASAILASNRRIIEATLPYAACFKPNLAFYEAHGPAGMSALEQTLALIPRELPVILDAKRCDIDATAEAYATALFGSLRGDAVTLSPYMGRDAVDPFLAWPGRGVFLLCRTSNKGAGVFQDIQIGSPAPTTPSLGGAGPVRGSGGSVEPLYLRVARECLSWTAPGQEPGAAVGLVVAGNDLAALRAVRAAVPQAWFLSPGIGAQGGDPAAAFEAGARPDGLGILVMAARSVAEAPDPALAARNLRDAMNRAAATRAAPRSAPGFTPAAKPAPASGLSARLVKALVDTGCFRLGDFVLKSGKKSPFYIDLRRLVSDPRALAVAGEAYASLAATLDYDRIAGIPAAALPLATAASLASAKPMIWPRMPVKDHGTGNRVEGEFAAGERALLLDDLITTGASKHEALEILRGEGLKVEDLVVLVERGKQARKDMESVGVRLHAFLHVRTIFAELEALGIVDAAKRRELEAFVDAE